MTRAGMVRPVVIPNQKELSPDVLRSNLRTLGISREQFEELLDSLWSACFSQAPRARVVAL